MERLNDEQLNVLDKEILEFYCQEAAKRLEDYIRVESTITERCYILFGIYYAIIAASMGYVLSNLDKQMIFLSRMDALPYSHSLSYP